MAADRERLNFVYGCLSMLVSVFRSTDILKVDASDITDELECCIEDIGEILQAKEGNQCD